MGDAEVERLITRLIGDGSSFQKMMLDAQNAATDAAKHIEKETSRIGTMLGVVVASVTGLAGLGVVMSGVKSAFNLASEAEQTQVAFETMLGSAAAGMKMYKDLQAYAAATPLDTRSLTAAAKTLLQFGVAGKDVLPTLGALGDVSGGNAEKLQSMALAFGQMSSSGKLSGHELREMVFAGFNPLQVMAQEAAKSTGTVEEHMARLRKEMEAGAISVDMVKGAFITATAEGGRFHGMLDKQGKTVGGLTSTLKDNLAIAAIGVGDKLIQAFDVKAGLDKAIAATNNLGSVLKELEPAITIVKAAFAEAADFAKRPFALMAELWESVGKPALQEAAGAMGGLKGVGAKLGDAWLDTWQAIARGAVLVQAQLAPIESAVLSLAAASASFAAEWLKNMAMMARGMDATWRPFYGTIAFLWNEIVIEPMKMGIKFLLGLVADALTQMKQASEKVLGEGKAPQWIIDARDAVNELHNKAGDLDKLKVDPGQFGDALQGGAAAAENMADGLGFAARAARQAREAVKGFDKDIADDKINDFFDRVRNRVGAGFGGGDVDPFKPGPLEKGLGENLPKVAGEAGKTLGKAVKDELKDLTAVIFGSAESLTRLAAYREKIVDFAGGGSPGLAGGGMVPAEPNLRADAKMDMVAIVKVLMDIRDDNRKRGDPIVVQEAGLG